MDVRIINKGDIEYPRALLDLKNPPERLYAKGNLQLLTQPKVAIVGTRDCTRYGLSVAKDLAEKCAAAGLCVVSGLAEGIDSAAHQGAPGATIAVLGNGLDIYYPIINHDLQEEIAANGLLLSEYPLGFHGDRRTFPQRNRIVAALGQVVVAVEADLRSGTLITVSMAKSLHREVFAVPGNINCYASQGTNQLIADKIAKMLTKPEDVLRCFNRGKIAESPAKVATKQVTFEQKNILDILKTDEVHIDELLERSNMGVAELSTLLTNMEMIGLIEKLPGNYYVVR